MKALAKDAKLAFEKILVEVLSHYYYRLLLVFPHKAMVHAYKEDPVAVPTLNRLTELLRVKLDGRKVEIVDFLARAAASEALLYFVIDGHFNEVGHAMVADLLAGKLAAR